jgi:hypothetical protein
MKLSGLALPALITAVAVATPVLAADSYGFDSDYVIAQLRYDGITAIDVDDYGGGTFRALVVLDDGSKVVQMFDRDSFRRIK